MTDFTLAIILHAALAFWAGAALLYDRSSRRLRTMIIDGKPVAGSHIVVTRAFLNGRAGLLNHASLAPRHGLLLRGSRRIHTRGMLFAIDVVFLDRDFHVVAVHDDVAPDVSRLQGPRNTAYALELAAGQAALLGLQTGSQLDFPGKLGQTAAPLLG